MCIYVGTCCVDSCAYVEQTAYNTLSMYIQCIYNVLYVQHIICVHTMCCTYNTLSVYIQCTYNVLYVQHISYVHTMYIQVHTTCCMYNTLSACAGQSLLTILQWLNDSLEGRKDEVTLTVL
eukprot:GHVS01022737.1.p2 GENE.GHVS01022737.1~~GHVS01022737.1.p2  ORF type:complete len:121 (+),score=15.56 GHVS01022737.1:1098-1460(+)